MRFLLGAGPLSQILEREPRLDPHFDVGLAAVLDIHVPNRPRLMNQELVALLFQELHHVLIYIAVIEEIEASNVLLLLFITCKRNGEPTPHQQAFPLP
jgi:hypothetical protein